jgi:hypothetical protein
MSSIIYNSFWDDVFKGNINTEQDSFKVMLLSSAYTPDKDAHTKRSDLTGEVSGAGYTAGGAAATVTSTKDLANDRLDIALQGHDWANASVTARYAAYYKSRGGAATADELVAVIDFGANVTSTNATFSLTASTIRIQN